MRHRYAWQRRKDNSHRPGINNPDLALFKNTKFGESHSVQFLFSGNIAART